jgi:hypothetical protein
MIEDIEVLLVNDIDPYGLEENNRKSQATSCQDSFYAGGPWLHHPQI